jgi:hypothetical protein
MPVARKNRLRAGSPGRKIRVPGLICRTGPLNNDLRSVVLRDGFASIAVRVEELVVVHIRATCDPSGLGVKRELVTGSSVSY